MNAKRIWLVLLLAGIVVACSPDPDSAPPEPPVPPSKAQIEYDLVNHPLLWGEPEIVYAIQRYCAYTDECDTKHVWLDETWGYTIPSYQTTVFGDKITVEGVLIAHVSTDGKCPAGQEDVGAFRGVTAQGVWDSERKPIHVFCLEKLQ